MGPEPPRIRTNLLGGAKSYPTIDLRLAIPRNFSFGKTQLFPRPSKKGREGQERKLKISSVDEEVESLA